jgi:exopolyphosphatase / guanosine-5'-triphosphate,3'-diphosphate pyrophosphatase
VRRACIDIGSNTTRLLVADCDADGLVEIHQERSFTHVRRALTPGADIGAAKIDEVVTVVAAQIRQARDLGAVDVLGVATAAVRRAGNGDALVSAVREACGIEVAILAPGDEARLAFTGAARTLGHAPSGPLGVVDVGGGSSELVVGTVPDQVTWFASFEVGSGELADECLRSDPPTAAELDRARARIGDALDGVRPPRAATVVAVGGGATSLRRIAGPVLDGAAFGRVLGVLAAERAVDVAQRFELDPDRVKLLPAGLLILQAASECFGAPLAIAHGGLREGVLLEASRG